MQTMVGDSKKQQKGKEVIQEVTKEKGKYVQQEVKRNPKVKFVIPKPIPKWKPKPATDSGSANDKMNESTSGLLTSTEKALIPIDVDGQPPKEKETTAANEKSHDQGLQLDSSEDEAEEIFFEFVIPDNTEETDIPKGLTLADDYYIGISSESDDEDGNFRSHWSKGEKEEAELHDSERFTVVKKKKGRKTKAEKMKMLIGQVQRTSARFQ
ncbi:OLC1v1007958C1 [Oldenlandia corymbosa var. corymbosa]|uniref:OLC1v1007958C1 n=1 Tax=Oldenlandia corymbosa var. corymbosa TaxID=529605 RepID=A0AAV1DKH3_OLDCO|nr:OLC1v1007958C1 [Oldenlandia corymbosa var. corymbosa]